MQTVLHDVPDFEDRRRLLESLKNRLEALLTPKLMSAFHTRSVGTLSECRCMCVCVCIWVGGKCVCTGVCTGVILWGVSMCCVLAYMLSNHHAGLSVLSHLHTDEVKQLAAMFSNMARCSQVQSYYIGNYKVSRPLLPLVPHSFIMSLPLLE